MRLRQTAWYAPSPKRTATSATAAAARYDIDRGYRDRLRALSDGLAATQLQLAKLKSERLKEKSEAAQARLVQMLFPFSRNLHVVKPQLDLCSFGATHLRSCTTNPIHRHRYVAQISIAKPGLFPPSPGSWMLMRFVGRELEYLYELLHRFVQTDEEPSSSP